MNPVLYCHSGQDIILAALCYIWFAHILAELHLGCILDAGTYHSNETIVLCYLV